MMTDPRPDPYTEQVGPRYEPEVQPLKEPLPRRPLWDGCAHTTDPFGWLMGDDGRIYGRCNCGEVPAE